jgi:hypothetical protein
LGTTRFQGVDRSTGRPASLGSVTFYEPGTTTLKNVFVDREGTSPAPNPTPLDASGSADVFLLGAYRIEVYDANGVLVDSADQVNSIPVETPEGNPGALRVNQNLGDVESAEAARANLGLVKAASTSDASAGRIALVGQRGYGGLAIGVGSVTDFDGFVVSGRFDVANISALANRPAGLTGSAVLDVEARGGTGRIVQRLDVVGSTTARGTYKRTLTGGGWTRWVRVYDQDSAVGTCAFTGGQPSGALLEVGSGAGGRWRRQADGMQVCTAQIQLTFSSTAELAGTWTYPAAFAAPPYFIAATLTGETAASAVGSVTSGLASGVTRAMLGQFIVAPRSATSCTVILPRITGQTNFASGDIAHVLVRAEGVWA